MSVPNAEDLIRTALAKRQIEELLLGRDPYAYMPPYSPAVGPTDLAEVLRILYEVCLPELTAQVADLMIPALESLVERYEGLDAVATCILTETLSRSRSGPIIGLPIDDLAKRLRHSIAVYRDRLVADKSGEGAVWPDGMVGMFRRLSRIVVELGGPELCDL
jgi:hypothetical protein